MNQFGKIEGGVEQDILSPDFDPAAHRKMRMREDQQRLVQHLKDGTTDSPEKDPLWHDPSIYTDPALAKLEQERIFRRLPILAALSQDVTRPGDVTLFEAAGTPIFLTRGKDNVVRGFLNLCRHRGARLVNEGDHRSIITCPYHSWGYDLKGSLVSLPCAEEFEPIDRSKLGLYQVPTAEWEGMIFVEPHVSDAPIDLAAHLGPMAPEFAQLELQGAVKIREDIIPTGCNWKYALDTNFESYHFGTLHPKTVIPAFASGRATYTRFGKHHRFQFARHAWNDFISVPESEWPDLPYESLQFVFPNSLIQSAHLNNGEGACFIIHNNYPGPAPDTSFNVLKTYRGANTDPKFDAEILALHQFVITVLTTEDYPIASGAQHNIPTAPEGFKMLLGRNESAMHHFHANLREAVSKA